MFMPHTCWFIWLRNSLSSWMCPYALHWYSISVLVYYSHIASHFLFDCLYMLSGRSTRRCTSDPVVLGSNSSGKTPTSIKLPLVLPRHQGGGRQEVPSSRYVLAALTCLFHAPYPSLFLLLSPCSCRPNLGCHRSLALCGHSRHHTTEKDEDVMLLLLVVYASAWLAVVMHIFVGNAIWRPLKWFKGEDVQNVRRLKMTIKRLTY